MEKERTPSYVFGPVPSRRLGRSLGVDVVPFKTCTYDCVYCQLGRTTQRTTQRQEYVPADEVIGQVQTWLAQGEAADYILALKEKRREHAQPTAASFAGEAGPLRREPCPGRGQRQRILDELLASLPDDAPVQQAVAGVRWTAVVSRTCGLASRLPSACSSPAPLGSEVGDWKGSSARDLAHLVRSPDLHQASLGLAALNSLLPVDANQGTDENAAAVLAEVGRGRTVAVVGHFPFTSSFGRPPDRCG